MARSVTKLVAAAILALTWETASAQTSVEIVCDIDYESTTRGVGRPPLVIRRNFTQTFTVNLTNPVTVITRYRLDDDSNPVQELTVHRTVPVATTHALVLCERDDFACDREKELPLGRGMLTTDTSLSLIDLKQGTYTRRDRASLEVDGDRMETYGYWSGTCRTRSGEPLPLPPVTRRADWFWRPFSRDIERFFPDTAARQQVSGKGTALCTVGVDGKLSDCQVASESPEGFGFGEATVRASRMFRFIPAVVNGQFESSQVRVPMSWNAP